MPSIDMFKINVKTDIQAWYWEKVSLQLHYDEYVSIIAERYCFCVLEPEEVSVTAV